MTPALASASPGAVLSGLSAADCAAAMGLDGLTVSLTTTAEASEIVWFDPDDRLGLALDDLQFTLGEGPCVDMARTGIAVFQTDWAAVPPSRWPVFTPAALDRGARTVLAPPLVLGAVRLGVLTGSIVPLVLTAPEATVGLDALDSQRRALHRAEVHQAAGMIAVRQVVSLQMALLRLPVYAFSHDHELLDVARAVIDGRLHHLDYGAPGRE